MKNWWDVFNSWLCCIEKNLHNTWFFALQLMHFSRRFMSETIFKIVVHHLTLQKFIIHLKIVSTFSQLLFFLYFTVHFDQNNLNFVPSAILYQINHLFTNTISRRADNLYTRTPPIFACKFLNIHRFSHRLLIIRRPFKYGQETRQRRSKQWVILITKLNNRAAN